MSQVWICLPSAKRLRITAEGLPVRYSHLTICCCAGIVKGTTWGRIQMKTRFYRDKRMYVL